MTATQVLEFSQEDIVTSLKSGTANRRVRAHILSYNVGTATTLNLDTYMTGAEMIEGMSFGNFNSTQSQGTASPTWSGTVITLPRAGTAELIIVVKISDGNKQY